MIDQTNGCPVKRKISAQGGVDQYSKYSEVISGWSLQKGVRPKGAPVSITMVCGQFSNGDIIYVDPRPEMQVKASGWVWSKTYVVPDHSRLFFNTCTYPEDGVFWMAINKL
jgi:hypothetical protein